MLARGTARFDLPRRTAVDHAAQIHDQDIFSIGELDSPEHATVA
jgi:hypothetical protein